jgi:hypothetical protein
VPTSLPRRRPTSLPRRRVLYRRQPHPARSFAHPPIAALGGRADAAYALASSLPSYVATAPAALWPRRVGGRAARPVSPRAPWQGGTSTSAGSGPAAPADVRGRVRRGPRTRAFWPLPPRALLQLEGADSPRRRFATFFSNAAGRDEFACSGAWVMVRWGKLRVCV